MERIQPQSSSRPAALPIAGLGSAHREPVPTRSMPLVLIADDERDIVDFLSILLKDEGFRVVGAYDGEQAWRLVKTERPALVISDVSMPRLTGVELVHRLRLAKNGLEKLPVILMSALDTDVPHPVAPIIAKPFDLDHMLSLVSSELTPSRQQRGVA